MTRALLVCGLVAVAVSVRADSGPSLSGRWLVTVDNFGTPQFLAMELVQDGPNLSGSLAGDPLEGTIAGAAVRLHSKDAKGGTRDAEATLADGALGGTMVSVFSHDLAHPQSSSFTAVPFPARGHQPPRRHDFAPSVYFRQYSATQKPVLAVAPGDTLHTTTVDAGGIDAHGVRRSAAGDPLTGPFFIETAMPGDTLVVHIVHLKLNRDWALSGDGIVGRGLNDDLAVTMRDAGQPVRWRLDLARNLAVTEKPGDHLAHFTVPIHPMLGCIGVAPSPGEAPPNTVDSGPWGGNMDFNELGEGATVFLPVRNPGAPSTSATAMPSKATAS